MLQAGGCFVPQQPLLLLNITATNTLFLSLTPPGFDGLLGTVAF
jgi:hypothetical protein